MAKTASLEELHLILGGARSGKTGYALSLADNSGLEKWMVATARAGDSEMRERIARHRRERGVEWNVLEEGIEIAAILDCYGRRDRVLVVDCLTLWLSNLFLEGRDLPSEMEKLAEAAIKAGGPILFVTNEIGLGLVPESSLGRDFRDAQGALNQRLAAVCKAVTLVVAGLPIALKWHARPT